MGKILVEKLLASCPGIGQIFLIIREKKGQNAEERLKDLMSQSVSKTHFTQKKLKFQFMIGFSSCPSDSTVL